MATIALPERRTAAADLQPEERASYVPESDNHKLETTAVANPIMDQITLDAPSQEMPEPHLTRRIVSNENLGDQARFTLQHSLRPLPGLTPLARAHPAVTLRVAELLRTLWAVVLSHAIQSGFDRFIASGAVDVETDPDEGSAKVLIRVYSDANPVQTFAFWQSLAAPFDVWLGQLREVDRQLVLFRIGLRFHWHAE